MIIRLLFLLFAAHFLCDYPLQGDFLAKGKNRFSPLPGVPWFWCLFGHAMIHAAAVYLITQNPIFAAVELVIHYCQDDMKCAGKLSFNGDQLLHLWLKALYVTLMVAFR